MILCTRNLALNLITLRLTVRDLGRRVRKCDRKEARWLRERMYRSNLNEMDAYLDDNFCLATDFYLYTVLFMEHGMFFFCLLVSV